MKKRYDVFISYRREEGNGLEIARIIDSAIDKTLWYHSFLDYNELKDRKFGPQIMAAIDSAPVFLALMTPGSLNRCIQEGDWVRDEIQYAISKKKHIVPVNPNGAVKWSELSQEVREKLPEDIRQALFDEQQSEIVFGQLFKQSISKLIKERIKPYVPRVILLRRILFSLLAVFISGLLALSFALIHKNMELKADYAHYAKCLKEARLQARISHYSPAAVDLIVQAGTYSHKYSMTRYSHMFDAEYRTLRDSLFVVYKKMAKENIEKFYDDSTYKVDAINYIEATLKLKYDRELQAMNQIINM